MKAIFNRLRRLENATAPAERERAAVDAILNRRRTRYVPVRLVRGMSLHRRPHPPRSPYQGAADQRGIATDNVPYQACVWRGIAKLIFNKNTWGQREQ